ncbi:MAG: N5-glutamine methyltransferase family protein [Actinomycetales bacterium]
MAPPSLADALRRGQALLADVSPSPRADVELLAGHLLGLGPGQLRAAAIRGACAPAGLDDLVQARAAGVPVQHLTGQVTFRELELACGPGVFIPRPETELVAGEAISAAAALSAPIVVDLCAGSGAIAAAVAVEVSRARVWAVEIDPVAAGYARQNLPPHVTLVVADALSVGTLADLDGTVDVVVSNPPYVPDGAWVSPEAAHDPPIALFAGPDGWQMPLALAGRARRLLHPGGLLVLEHHDHGQPEIASGLQRLGYREVVAYEDLAGRPRYLTARR